MVTGNNLETVVAAQKALPEDVVVYRANSGQVPDASRIADELKHRFGRIDFAFLNAGIGRMLPLEAVDEADFDEHFDINVKGKFFALQKILPLFSDSGSIVFTTAVGAHRGVPAWSVYSATAGAISGLIPALAVELAPRGIRVNAVRPGPTDTPAFGKLGLPAEAIAVFQKSVPQRIPLGRFGKADEIAEVVAFLASPAARNITGTTIDVDGGMSSVASLINLI
jgi:NAD(P)-dependent dehydrogenase (short-subunit alcohol dehydrogenase family)